MDKRDWIVIGLSLQLTLMGLALTRLAYQLGYERGRIHVLTTFDDTSEGTCMVPHCNDKPIKGEK